jgi:hypothetical protein
MTTPISEGALRAIAHLRARTQTNPCQNWCGKDTGSDVMPYCSQNCAAAVIDRASKAANVTNPILRPATPAEHRPDPEMTPSARLYYKQKGQGWI